MNETRWQRWGALSGVPFVALVIAGAFVVGEPPAPDAQISEVRQFLTDNQDQYRLGGVLTMLGGFFAFWFLSAVYSHLRRAETDNTRFSLVTYGAGISTVMLALAATAPILGLTYYGGIQTADDGMIRFLWNMSTLAYVPLSITTAAFAGSIALNVFETRSLPQWIAWAGAITAIINLVSVFGVTSDDLEMAMTFGIAAFTSAMVMNLCLAGTLWTRGTATSTRMSTTGRPTTAS